MKVEPGPGECCKCVPAMNSEFFVVLCVLQLIFVCIIPLFMQSFNQSINRSLSPASE